VIARGGATGARAAQARRTQAASQAAILAAARAREDDHGVAVVEHGSLRGPRAGLNAPCDMGVDWPLGYSIDLVGACIAVRVRADDQGAAL